MRRLPGTPLEIAVVGAGIGGLASALALSADGHAVTVLERRTGFGEPGAGIQLSPNAVHALDALGVQVARQAVAPAGITVRDLRSGRVLAEVELGSGMRSRYGAPYLVIARRDLHTALLDAVRGRAGIRLLVGRTLVSLTDTPDGVDLGIASANGAHAAMRVDLAVAADGLASVARHALGDARPLVPSGYAAARAVLPAAALPEGLAPNRTGLWLGRGRHVVHYPIDAGRLVNVVVVDATRGPPAARGSGEGWSEPVDTADLARRFAQTAPALRQLVAAGETWARWSLADLPVRRMHGRRIALVGDAAHPVLPYFAQGGAMALEDAVELAHVLRHGSDLGAALARYGAARLGRARRVQETARRNGRIFHLGGLPAVARNLAMSAMGPERATHRYDWLYGWRPSEATEPAA